MVAKGLIDPAAPRRRYRRTKAEIEAAAALLPPGSNAKRRRGRPRKADVAAEEAAAAEGGGAAEGGSAAGGEGAEGGGEGGGAAAAAAKPQRRKRKKVETAPTPTVDPALVGRAVTGVLDGCFDAGYLLTVRVGDSDVVLRGVLFGPGLTVPVTKNNDIAPDVKFVRKDETVVMPPAPPAAALAAATAAVAAPPAAAVAPVSVPPVLFAAQTPLETPVSGAGAAAGQVPLQAAALAQVKADGVEAAAPPATPATVARAEVASPTPLPDVHMEQATVSPVQESASRQGFGVAPAGFAAPGSAGFSTDSARPVNVQMGA